MITPEDLSYMLDMLKVHKELEESILRDITRRILKSGFVTDTAAYQAEKLTEAGLCYDDMLDKISKSTKKSRKEIKQAFDDAETRVFDYDETLLTDAGINAYEFKKISPRMKRIIAAALAKTTTDAINLTKTTANTVQSLYISACDLAHMQVISGAFDYNTAIKNAIVFAAKQGVKVVYPTGAISSLDTAVRRSVLTGVNQTFAKITEMRAKEFDVDLMQTSAHIGARPEHAVWQGYIVSLSGRKGYLSLSDVGYGDVRGIFGANCRHSWNMFFEGVSHMQYTEKQLAEMRDATVTYNGEKMEVWRARDKQRAMERSIKSTKRELICFDEAVKSAKNPKEKNDFSNKFSALSVQLKRKEAKLADFTKQTGLKRDRVREQVFAAESKNGIKNFGKSVSQKAVKSAQLKYDIWRKSIGADDTPKTLAKYYEMKYNDKKEYSRLQKYAKMVEKGEATPLMGYDLYKQTALEIEEKLIGTIAKDGTLIKDYSAHFVCRAFGHSGLSKKTNRDGVAIDIIKDALINGNLGKTQIDKMGEKSVAIFSEDCIVTLNPKKQSLIQVNPLRRL